MLLTQIGEGRCCVENQYTAMCERGRQSPALAILNDVFEVRPHFRVARPGLHPRERLKLRQELPSGMRSFVSTCRVCASRIRRPASVARC